MGENAQANTSYAALFASANHIGKECLNFNRAFAECKLKNDNPKKCVAEGEKVTACVLKVLRHAEEHCAESFTAYQKCLDHNDRRLNWCRDEQAAFEKCFDKVM
uniref:Uncharacterized protein n=1 Tax=Mucochytrium quahogii TaxID=96639 RepID=A0A7S2WMS0_9STRA|mmetsp:Transcript_16797/g.27220  ORF Transcript_16797/g.27220 Transcript_16797/m.27220 type:complete len:104 (-) Transcript_16797:1763-2074(-)|eukprot:CAMPEP_0203747684 /NCGR_PEP_ID=MMETSP0098-20131031/2759_1 /ASSEMBLY_ACC=CAM_ASM_000208 /TAXON_ID=96639 /ORGANISM=" , Strain NY0313808BC1" /LENGTH=103 /DNA_ID=CAMNT_0050636177 /DNA_START=529 /DNA_END=840 /DNA_ORIENTATION=-